MQRRKILFINLLIAAATLSGCYYRYSYRLIEPENVKIDWLEVRKEGTELIHFFEEKYIYILGVIDKEDKIILFNKRKPVLITTDKRILAVSLDDDELTIDLNKVKYFYLKRRMPYTEEESNHP